MKRVTQSFTIFVTALLFIWGNTAVAQDYNFENFDLGHAFAKIGWSQSDVVATVAVDPVAAGNKVLKNEINNYNGAPVLEFVIPEGKTLADYSTFNFKGYFAQGDVGWKDIMVEAYQTMPTGQFNNAAARIGTWNRASGGSTAWEDITINVTNTLAYTGTVYIAFGINCAGTGSIGGAGLPTIWYADDILFIGESGSDDNFVSLWGKTSAGTAWPILNDASTPAGSAGMGDGNVPTGWATIRGEFESLQATTTDAVVVTGQLELVGGGGASGYTHLRYALTFQDSTTLNFPLTDSAAWASTKGNYGYGFHPRSGNGTMSNARGGGGTLWLIDGGGFNSGWGGNNTAEVGANGNPVQILQAPRNAEMVEGTYNFGISVKMVDDTTAEVNWYLVEENNKYWFGGSEIVKAKTDKFNGIMFGVNNDTEAKQFNLMSVKAFVGDPVDVPEAPWEDYYIDQWGLAGEGKAWPILNDSTTLVGDATLGDGNPPTGWATMRGGFGQDLPLKEDKFLVVTGQIQLEGGGAGSGYTHLRYAMTFQDSSTLQNALTDSAAWVSTKGHYGYGFHPRSGNGTMSNARGGGGTLWLLDGGGFNSGWGGNNTAEVGINGNPVQILQAPRNAEMIEGTYNFAMAVRPINDTTSEVRWYLVELNNKYWFGGSEIVKAKTDKFNGISFGVNNDTEAKYFHVIEAKVDYVNDVVVPEAPWEAYYVDQWGLSEGTRTWPILNDEETLVGDATFGNGSPPTGWAAMRGGFGQNLELKEDKFLIVTGQIQLEGGGGADGYTHLRYAMTFQDSSTLQNALTDSAAWVSTKGHYGYGFHPRSGNGTMSNARGGAGTLWLIDGGAFHSGWGGNNTAQVGINGNTVQINQAPRNAVMVEGTYDFAMAVRAINDTTSEVKWYLIEVNNQYWFGGSVIAKGRTNKFNGISFGVNNDSEAKYFHVIEAKVDYVDDVFVPMPPFEPFYVGEWGFIGDYNGGGWELTPGEFDGNVSVAGAAKPSTWMSLRGGFPMQVGPTTEKALVIEGQMEFVGGGFDGWSALRLGVLYSDNAGQVVDSNHTWSGTVNNHYGYLFLPHSGNNDLTNWQGVGQTGTVGAIVDRNLVSTNGGNDYVLNSVKQLPANAVGGAGVYDFSFSFGPVNSDGSIEIRYFIRNSDFSYVFADKGVYDRHDPRATEAFNAINFALSNTATATALNLVDVYVDQGSPIEIPDIYVSVDEKDGQIPTEFALSQNYPNPFNPTTTIEFALPKNSNVKLVVYDILGRAVAQLVNSELNSGYHKVNFNASNLASGIYFYRIEAGDFVNVKKLMLLK